MGYFSRDTSPDDGRSISLNVAHSNILIHDMINLLYYEYWTDKQKYLYVYCVNPLCSCSLEVESVFHFFLRCHSFTDIRKTLFHELQLVDENILNQSDNETAELLLYGSGKFKLEQNCSILRSAIKFIIKSERFSGSIVQ